MELREWRHWCVNGPGGQAAWIFPLPVFQVLVLRDKRELRVNFVPAAIPVKVIEFVRVVYELSPFRFVLARSH